MTDCASSPQLISDLEQCSRKGFLARSWTAKRISSKGMVNLALRASLTATGQQEWGELAGAEVLQLAEDRGLETEQNDIYGQVMHHAALADILVSSIRKPTEEPWIIPPPVQNWTSDCFLSPDGRYLRRYTLVSHWNDQRHYSECRSWYSIGEIVHYKLPMQLIVLVVGQERLGKRLSPWVSGFLHPMNHELRFRKKSRSKTEVFNDSWEKVYREQHAEITRETWLNRMLKDDVLPEVCFRVDIPVPNDKHCERIRDMAARKIERLVDMEEKPEANLSSCDWPIPCLFRGMCHTLPERNPNEKNGFIKIEHCTQASPASIPIAS